MAIAEQDRVTHRIKSMKNLVENIGENKKEEITRAI